MSITIMLATFMMLLSIGGLNVSAVAGDIVNIPDAELKANININ